MIRNFEHETKPLSIDEQDAAKALATLFNKNPNMRFTEPILSKALAREKNLNIKGSRFRKVINYIRMNSLVINLLADNRGYYKSNEPRRIKAYIKSLDDRIDAIKAVRDSFIIPNPEEKIDSSKLF